MENAILVVCLNEKLAIDSCKSPTVDLMGINSLLSYTVCPKLVKADLYIMKKASDVKFHLINPGMPILDGCLSSMAWILDARFSSTRSSI